MSNPTFIFWAGTLDVMAADDLFPVDDANDAVEAEDVDGRIFATSTKLVEQFIGEGLLGDWVVTGEWRTPQQMGSHDFDAALAALSKSLIGAVQFETPSATYRVMWTCDI